MHWAKSKGDHAGELSKADFRKAVLNLFAGKKKDDKPRSRRSSREDSENFGWDEQVAQAGGFQPVAPERA